MTEFVPYRTQTEVEEVVRRFEVCEYTPEEFVHAKHLTVAAYYFWKFDKESAEKSMYAGLRKFISYHGKDGYHETITRFWLHMVGYRAKSEIREKECIIFVNEIVERLGDKNLIYEYFSHKHLYSAEAKATCADPDLKPLP